MANRRVAASDWFAYDCVLYLHRLVPLSVHTFIVSPLYRYGGTHPFGDCKKIPHTNSKHIVCPSNTCECSSEEHAYQGNVMAL